MAQDYRDLLVWKKAIDLTACVCKLTQSLPREELYGLSSQMRRASISVATNIAEGRGRLNIAEFRQFLGVAQGSIYEGETPLIVPRKLGLGRLEAMDDAASLSNQASKMLASFIRTLNVRSKKPLADPQQLAASS